MATYFGIDCAKWQGTINWAKVKSAGVQVAILKATDKNNGPEPAFARNYAGATAQGIKIGCYRYVYARTVAAAENEARKVLAVIQGKAMPAGVWLDLEDKTLRGIPRATMLKMIAAMTKIIKAAGYQVGIYTNPDWYNHVLDVSKITLPFWVASWGTNNGKPQRKPTIKAQHTLAGWQYTDKGRVAGISTAVDLSQIYRLIGQAKSVDDALLRKGDRGDDIKLLQHRLNILGNQLTEDGIWGVQTDSAVRGYQYRAGLTVDGIVGAKTRAALIRDAILARAAEMGAYMVKHKWHYKDTTYKAKDTWAATKALSKPSSSCSHFVSWVLQDVGLLVAGKRISHDNGKVTGTGNLLGCQIIPAGGKTWDKLPDLRPGDVCVWDSNLAIYAGNGKWYDAGGPFRSNTKDGRYTNIGPIAPYYDRTKPVYYLVRAKV